MATPLPAVQRVECVPEGWVPLTDNAESPIHRKRISARARQLGAPLAKCRGIVYCPSDWRARAEDAAPGRSGTTMITSIAYRYKVSRASVLHLAGRMGIAPVIAENATWVTDAEAARLNDALDARDIARQRAIDAGNADCEALARMVAGQFGLSVEQLRSRLRNTAIMRARAVWIIALADSGMRPTAIAAICGMDHSTVLHHIGRRGHYTEDLAVLGLDLVPVEYARCGTKLTARLPLPGALATGLATLPEPWRGHIHRYTVGMLLAPRPAVTGDILRGLAYLAASPPARAVLAAALDLAGQKPSACRVELHARHLGYRWIS